MWRLGHILARGVMALQPAGQPVRISIDDTTDGPHRGRKVYGHGCWRDAVRSSWGHLTYKWGLKWVVLVVHTRIPFTPRTWALPILVCLARKPALDQAEGRPHKTAADQGRQMLAALIHWFPDRHFYFTGDWGFGSHELAWFCHRHRQHITLIARCRADTNLYAQRRPRQKQAPRRQLRTFQPPLRPSYTCRKGRKLPTPQQTVQKAQRVRRTVRWYGNSQRELEMVSACGGWYRGRGGGRAALVPIRWVYTFDPQTQGEDCFLCTDPTWLPQRILEEFSTRWGTEVTFEEVRAWLGLETTRNWTKASILRMAPCLFGLFTVISLIYARILEQRKPAVRQTPAYAKEAPTFSDALFQVRKLLWEKVILQHRFWHPVVALLPTRLRLALLERLTEAA